MTPNEEAALEELIWELSAPHTQDAIAARLGLSERHVRRIEAAALEKMRSFVSDDEWLSGVKEPPSLARRMNAVFPSDGSSPRDERE